MALSFSGGSGADASGYGISASNYADVFGFDNAETSTNLPQIYEREVTIYGNRTLMGFLRMIGSETSTNSQQIRWAEQKRLHIFESSLHLAVAAQVLTLTELPSDHAFRINDKVLVGRGGATALAIVTSISTANTVVATAYQTGSDLDITGSAQSTDRDASILVIGSEVGKGSNSRDRIVQPKYDSYTNSTVIMRDTYGVNGTDANQIGWVESVDENGASGKYWYLKGKSETMTRWEDYLELSLLEDRFNDGTAAYGKGAEIGDGNFPANELKGDKNGPGGVSTGGSEGLFSAIEDRGNIATNGFGNAGAADFRESLDNIVKQLDNEGSIEENLFYLNRDESLNFDDGMATQNNGTGGTSTSWGVFNNSESMGLKLRIYICT